MNIDDIITLEDNVEYMVLDIVELNHERYLYCVEIDSEEMPKQEYKYFKEVIEDGTLYTEEVEDPNILETIISMFTMNHINGMNNEEQDG